MKTLVKTFSNKGVRAFLSVDTLGNVFVKYKSPQGCHFDNLSMDQIEAYVPNLNVLEPKMRTWCESNGYTLWSY